MKSLKATWINIRISTIKETISEWFKNIVLKLVLKLVLYLPRITKNWWKKSLAFSVEINFFYTRPLLRGQNLTVKLTSFFENCQGDIFWNLNNWNWFKLNLVFVILFNWWQNKGNWDQYQHIDSKRFYQWAIWKYVSSAKNNQKLKKSLAFSVEINIHAF